MKMILDTLKRCTNEKRQVKKIKEKIEQKCFINFHKNEEAFTLTEQEHSKLYDKETKTFDDDF